MLGKVLEIVAKRVKSPVGGRIRFRTDSTKVTINTKLKNNPVDWAIHLPRTIREKLILHAT